VVRHLGLYLWRSKQAVTNVQLGYWNDDDMCIMFCGLFLFCILLQIITSKLVREVLLLTYNANIGSCDCVRFAGALC
jgi:hypothetical protein